MSQAIPSRLRHDNCWQLTNTKRDYLYIQTNAYWTSIIFSYILKKRKLSLLFPIGSTTCICVSSWACIIIIFFLYVDKYVYSVWTMFSWSFQYVYHSYISL